MGKVIRGICFIALILVIIQCGSSYQLRGRVENPAFQPIAGAHVIVKLPGTSDSLDYVTDSQGKYRIEDLKSAQIQLIVRAPQYIPYNEFLVFEQPAMEKNVQLQYQQARIIGRIVDAESGKALPKAQITILGTNMRTISGFDGRFELGKGQLEKDITYELVITLSGYRAESKVVTIEHLRTYDLEDIPITRLAPRSFVQTPIGKNYQLNSSEDIEAPSTLTGVGGSPEVQRFLEENETFNYLQFRRLFMGQKLSDKAIRNNLRIYIEQGFIRQIDENTFESIIYKQKYHLK